MRFFDLSRTSPPDRHDRPRAFQSEGLLDVFEQPLGEGAAAVSVGDVRDMARDLEQHRDGHEQLAVGDGSGFVFDIGSS